MVCGHIGPDISLSKTGMGASIGTKPTRKPAKSKRQQLHRRRRQHADHGLSAFPGSIRTFYNTTITFVVPPAL